MIEYRQPFRGDYPISQQYGEVIEGLTYKGKPHTGIDYGCPYGTMILASADGIVMASGYDGSGFGNYIIILHERNKATVYAHLAERYVLVNRLVKQGDVIGISGSTGYSTGPHLHFEARERWNDPASHKDPVMYLPMRTFADVSSQPAEDSSQSSVDSSQLSEGMEPGVYRVVCDAAYVRGWERLNREKLVYRGERVYLFGDQKEYDGLKFYYIGGGSCMAASDIEGTVILEKEDGEKEK